MTYAIISLVSILCYITGRVFDIEWLELVGLICTIILVVAGGIKYLFEVQKYWENENI